MRHWRVSNRVELNLTELSMGQLAAVFTNDGGEDGRTFRDIIHAAVVLV
jgi:hypothetical protein